MKKLLLLTCSLIIIILVYSQSNMDKGLVNKELSYIIHQFGKPDNDTVLVLTRNTRLYEYQSNIYKLYPNLRKDSVLVREIFWVKKEKKTVVWFAKKETEWISIDNLTWTGKIKY